jgi:hypothetical protein
MYSIIIDGIKFTLVRKSQHSRSHPDAVNIISEKGNEQKEFWVYRSNSELGLWRFCAQKFDAESNKDIMFKGNTDYVQSSLIHLKLQQFIFKHLDSLPFVAIEKDEKRANCFCTNIKPDDQEPLCDTVEAGKMLNDEKRLILERPFSLMYQLYKQKVIGCGRVQRYGEKHERIEDYLKNFSLQFEKAYYIHSIPKLLYIYPYTFESIVGGFAAVYQLHLKRKVTLEESQTNDVFLHFISTSLTKLSPNEDIRKETGLHKTDEYVTSLCDPSKRHFFPFFLTTKDSKATIFGIYENFIPCGIYVCKLFDYIRSGYRQCSKKETKEKRCTYTYAYIGDRYKNLFPLDIVTDELQRKHCGNDEEHILQAGKITRRKRRCRKTRLKRK